MGKITSTIELILKIFSLLFILCLLIGSVVIGIYLYKQGIAKELTSFLASPQIMITVTIWSALLLLGIAGTIIVSPVLLILGEKIHGVDHSKKTTTKHQFFRFLYITSPIYSLFTAALLDLQEFYLVLYIISSSLLATALIHKSYGKENKTHKMDTLGLKYLYVLIAQFSFVFTMLYTIKAITTLENRDTYQWMLVTVFTLLYGLAAIKITPKKFASYIPIACLSSAIFIINFLGSVCEELMAKIGVGNYKTTFVVESKSLITLDNESLFKVLPSKAPDISILTEVWVVANMSNRIIIKPNKNVSNKYSIPSTAIIGERLLP